VQEQPAVLITRSVVETPAPACRSYRSSINAQVPSGVVLDSLDVDHDAAVAPADGADLNADVSDDEENDDYDAKGNLLYSVPPCDRVGLNDGMDGLYWLLSGEVRPRRAREVHTYGSDHIKVYRNKKPTVLTPEQEAARREQQQRRQAEERAARERSLEAYMERVKFESEGFPILDNSVARLAPRDCQPGVDARQRHRQCGESDDEALPLRRGRH
jgi:hypothetical protein